MERPISTPSPPPPSKKDNTPEPIKQTFNAQNPPKAIVCVDFGTDGVGLAFSFGDHKTIFHGQEIWSQNFDDNRLREQVPNKTKTSILLLKDTTEENQKGLLETVAFGTISLQKLSGLVACLLVGMTGDGCAHRYYSDAPTHAGSGISKTKPKQLLIERFKMALYG